MNIEALNAALATISEAIENGDDSDATWDAANALHDVIRAAETKIVVHSSEDETYWS